ncbi:MAG: phosphosulfolactate synthase [Limnochordia bacterium]|jgi:phosphosulfolactate synthase
MGAKGLGWQDTVKPPVVLETKPRDSGLTMAIDKGLGLAALADLLDMAAMHIDFLKLGFGTSMMYPRGMLEEKIALAHRYSVALYPGGTLLEVAELQNVAEAWLERLCRLGFNVVEVSDGTIPLTPQRRNSLIRAAVSRGLRVITEIGKKEKGYRFDADHVHAQIQADLESGAERVIIEARDSGRGVGVFDSDGRGDDRLIDLIIAGTTDPSVVMWEAPLVSQQQQLILKLGSNVNLGNVQPSDVITLAATRAGLRGDTFRVYAEQILGERGTA